MLYKAVAISTLAILAAADFSQQAVATGDIANSTPKSTASNYAVAVNTPSTPQKEAAITPPQTSTDKEFSQVAQTPNRSTNTSNVVVPTTPAQPSNQSPGKPTPQSPTTPTKPTKITNDLAVTATDVKVTGATAELQQLVLSTISTRAGSTTSQSQLDSDVATILNTGLFTDARVTTNPSRDGLNVVFQVQPMIVREIQLSGNQVLTKAIASPYFQSQIGQPVSLTNLRDSVQKLSKWYQDNGYVLAQVLRARPASNGIVTLEVAEGVIGKINTRFLDKEGKPTQGRTRQDFITSEVKLKPGQVFRKDVAQSDLQHLYQLGLFDYANISLDGDARKVDVTYDLIERSARGVNVGGGYSADSGLFGTVNFKDQNFNGVNQQVGLNLLLGGKDFQFDGNFTSPYRASNPDTPGYSLNVFRRRSLSQTFNNDLGLENGDQPREGQFGGGVSVTKPVNGWDVSAGLNYTRTSIRDSNGNITPTDKLGNQLSFSGTGVDDLVTVSAGISKDQRDNPYNPTQGSVMSFTTSQSIPIGSGSILMNQLKANYSLYTPVNLLGTKNSQVFAVNVQGGTTLGDLPPYMAFNIGGLNSVRGYGTGDVASGRSYVLASAEYRVPIFNPVGAVLFADFGSDLGTGNTVPGEPGVVRGKPGTGFGYGAGLRVDSPVGIIRADYGFTDQGDSKLQFGLGQRF